MTRTLFACFTLLVLSVGCNSVHNLFSRDNHPPRGYVALFDGKDLKGWKGLVANPEKRTTMPSQELTTSQQKADENMRQHWSAQKGVLTYDGHGDSICTIKDYGDFDMYVDWKITPEGDSGIYLRGTPQVQIWDPKSKPAAGVGSGGLYNNQKNPSKPTIVADKPPGQWNTFRIRMIGEKVTVWLNGKLVTDNVTLENYWDRKKPIYPTGQIELQNHHTPLWFKNIYIKELSR